MSTRPTCQPLIGWCKPPLPTGIAQGHSKKAPKPLEHSSSLQIYGSPFSPNQFAPNSQFAPSYANYSTMPGYASESYQYTPVGSPYNVVPQYGTLPAPTYSWHSPPIAMPPDAFGFFVVFVPISPSQPYAAPSITPTSQTRQTGAEDSLPSMHLAHYASPPVFAPNFTREPSQERYEHWGQYYQREHEP